LLADEGPVIGSAAALIVEADPIRIEHFGGLE
jgi:hypothetical protein